MMCKFKEDYRSPQWRRMFHLYMSKLSEEHILFLIPLAFCIYFYGIYTSITNISLIVVLTVLNNVLVKRCISCLMSDDHKPDFLKYILDMRKFPCIVFASSLTFVVTSAVFQSIDTNCNVLIFFTGLNLLQMIKYDDSVFRKNQEMLSADGLDYGSGMAYSFFHGYLNILLPDRGDENKGIKEMMTLYEDRNNVKLAQKKLYILASSNLYCPPNLRDATGTADGGPFMEEAATLGEVTRNRAGVIDRKYRNSVYKIFKDINSPPLYVVAEGATPLLTLYNSLSSTSPHCETYKEHKAVIVKMFCKTLKYLIQTNIECRDLCEIVYYDNDNGDANIAEILLEKINKDKSSNKCLL